jgi:hypothetical protein
MGWEQIANGNRNDFDGIPGYEALIDEGQRGRLDMRFSVNVPTAQIDALRNQLEWAGVEDLQVLSGSNTISVIYRKGPWWLPVIIVAVMVTLTAIFFYLTVWTISKETSGSTMSLALIGGAILAAAIAWTLIKKRH